MVRILESGKYKLIETWGHTKILQFNGKKSYAWIVAKNIGELLEYIGSRRDKMIEFMNSQMFGTENLIVDLTHIFSNSENLNLLFAETLFLFLKNNLKNQPGSQQKKWLKILIQMTLLILLYLDISDVKFGVGISH